MKVKDLLKEHISVDVYDDVCEELAITFVGPAELTEEGKEYFADVLELDVDFYEAVAILNAAAILNIDDPDDKVWKARLSRSKELFEGLAGYCAESQYKRWFKED